MRLMLQLCGNEGHNAYDGVEAAKETAAFHPDSDELPPKEYVRTSGAVGP